MSLIEKRAWLTLWTMCPGYLVYFAIQIGWPDWPSGFLAKFGLLAAVAGLHAIGYIAGELVFRFRNREEGLQQDERDDAIDARATRAAYMLLLAGTILAGAIMPFTDQGWKVANTALLFIVLSETLRAALTVRGYRHPRMAH
ncbi:hypothetical protein FNZ56_03825 [Pseudoluteimonas lycopersici]|uniref:DUF2178 domain-containing protein n=1 Tax=Pseudoluteimonas lycopersici TaxID=1324796 RepID=A0A516V3F5_9GAMM|nr:hypothetical protein [Lysobacter lycopersici]QDQ73059.1 hypothetical protein FNZ56_03825 [Lysobacter lycopersici]